MAYCSTYGQDTVDIGDYREIIGGAKNLSFFYCSTYCSGYGRYTVEIGDYTEIIPGLGTHIAPHTVGIRSL